MLEALPFPNPNPKSLAVNLAGPADHVEFRIYTPALIRVRTLSVAGNFHPGWNQVSLGNLFDGIASDVYFVQVRADRDAAQSSPVLTRVFLLNR